MPIPASRLRRVNSAPQPVEPRYIIYWCVTQRRTTYNFALEHAANEARRLGLPLIILEGLRLGYQWASERHHRFVIEGMRDNAAALAKATSVIYYPYVEPKIGAGKGLLAELSNHAALIVSDYVPYFFFPAMHHAAVAKLACPFELVDSNGILPLSLLTDRWSNVAHSFRRRIRDFLPEELERFPSSKPLKGLAGAAPKIEPAILKRWPMADLEALLAPQGMKHLKFGNSVGPATQRGGPLEAGRVLKRFLDERLEHYLERRLDLDDETCSGLSPWLHFGHISAHQVFEAVTAPFDWSIDKLAPKPSNKREGWWGLPAPADAFMDELITWRELGFHTCEMRPDYASFSSIPDWAKQSLALHVGDQRETIYDLETLAAAETGDAIWNAAQRQLLSEGRIHNAIRMVWGKLVLGWTRTPEIALDYLIELNNRYALDGRDPNSYSGILWCLGRHDRAWGPEREIFGKVRYMTSESFLRKSTSKRYLERWG